MENTLVIQEIESAKVVDITPETPTNDSNYKSEEALLRRLSRLEGRIRLANNNLSKSIEKIEKNEKINEKLSSVVTNAASKADIEKLNSNILSGLFISFALGSVSVVAILYLAKTL